MTKHAVSKLKNELQMLVISESMTEQQAEASMRILQDFNQCMVGLSHFSGSTPCLGFANVRFKRLSTILL